MYQGGQLLRAVWGNVAERQVSVLQKLTSQKSDLLERRKTYGRVGLINDRTRRSKMGPLLTCLTRDGLLGLSVACRRVEPEQATNPDHSCFQSFNAQPALSAAR